MLHSKFLMTLALINLFKSIIVWGHEGPFKDIDLMKFCISSAKSELKEKCTLTLLQLITCYAGGSVNNPIL